GGGEMTRMPGGQSRWSAGKDLSWEPLRVERVCEAKYDHLQGSRFRHAAVFQRWRPDKKPGDCRYDQLEVTPAYELEKVFGAANRPWRPSSGQGFGPERAAPVRAAVAAGRAEGSLECASTCETGRAWRPRAHRPVRDVRPPRDGGAAKARSRRARPPFSGRVRFRSAGVSGYAGGTAAPESARPAASCTAAATAHRRVPHVRGAPTARAAPQ